VDSSDKIQHTMKRRTLIITLYFACALVTAYTTFYTMMWAIWGAPINPLMYAALLGSGVLVIAGISAMFAARWSVYIGIAGSILCWTYYLPAAIMTDWLELPSQGWHGFAAVASLILLTCVTILSFFQVRRAR